jgi:hypothetical protein
MKCKWNNGIKDCILEYPSFAVSELTPIFLDTDLPFSSTYPWHSLDGYRGVVIVIESR